MRRLTRKIERHTWCGDIISPFDNISRNFYISGEYEKLNYHVVAFFEPKRNRSQKHGILLEESKANEQYYNFHTKDCIDNEI